MLAIVLVVLLKHPTPLWCVGTVSNPLSSLLCLSLVRVRSDLRFGSFSSGLCLHHSYTRGIPRPGSGIGSNEFLILASLAFRQSQNAIFFIETLARPAFAFLHAKSLHALSLIRNTNTILFFRTQTRNNSLNRIGNGQVNTIVTNIKCLSCKSKVNEQQRGRVSRCRRTKNLYTLYMNWTYRSILGLKSGPKDIWQSKLDALTNIKVQDVSCWGQKSESVM